LRWASATKRPRIFSSRAFATRSNRAKDAESP
jgi:hypothetical protein